MASFQELETLYRDAEQVDSDVFAEQRSNILLVSGKHYNNRSSKLWNRIRSSNELSTEQKIDAKEK
jgi:hypothetical protein